MVHEGIQMLHSKKGIHVSVSEEVGRNSVCEIQNKRLHTSLSEKALIKNDM